MNESTAHASSANQTTSTDTGIQSPMPISAEPASSTFSKQKTHSWIAKDSASRRSRSKAVSGARVGAHNFLNRGTWSNETFTATVNLKALARKVLREYHMWIAQMICEGKIVSMYDLGSIRASYRQGRKGVGSYKVDQPASYILKIKPSKKVKSALVRLAGDSTRLYFGLASRGSKKFTAIHERSNTSGGVTATKGFQKEPQVAGGSVGDNIHVQVGRENREALRVEEEVQKQEGADGNAIDGRGDRTVSATNPPSNTIP